MQRSLTPVTRILALFGLLACGLVALQPTNAVAADPLYGYTAAAGGTHIRALGTTIRSDLTSASTLGGTSYPAASANTLANVDVPGLLNVGAVETATSATTEAGTNTVTANARTAGISLLDGLITAEAVETKASATQTGTTFAGGSDSKLVDLTVGGTDIPITVSRNFTIGIPGIATVVINESKVDESGPGIKVAGSAIKITLLDGIGGAPIGTVITVNPTYVEFGLVDPLSVTQVGGFAYGTKVTARALGLVNVNSGPTALTSVPSYGTGGRTLVNSTAAADIPGLLSLGVVESTSMATSVPDTADVFNTHETGRVNVANGLVTVDAVRVTARAVKPLVGPVVKTATGEVANLRVLGLPINLKAAPNTRFSIPGIVTITLNEQVSTVNGITVVGLHVVVGPLLGNLAGADVQVAVAHSRAG